MLDAMGLESWRSQGAIRLSFGPAMTAKECNAACEAIMALATVVHKHCLVLSDATGGVDVGQDGIIQLKHEDLCSYLIICTERRCAIVIDPVLPLANRIANIIQGLQLQIAAVLDTHQHQDHHSARATLVSLLADRLSPEATDSLGWPLQHSVTEAGRYRLQRLATPGHSPEACSYLLYQQEQLVAAFVGDLLLPGGVGRTDLHGGSAEQISQSIRLLATVVPEQLLLLSSHDYAQRFFTTLALSRAEQPVLAAILADEPVANWQQALNKQATELQQQSSHLCGLVDVSLSDASGVISAEQLEHFLAEHPLVQIVDVREPYEQSAGALASWLPAQSPVMEIPLSRLADALSRRQIQSQQPLLLVCRSGNRSLLACKVLNRAGFDKVYNLKGGIALLSQ